MARARGSRAQMAFAFESVYGTPPGSGFVRLPFVSSGLASEQQLLDNDLLGYGRDDLAPLLDTLTADGPLTVPMDAQGSGYWLKLIFGDPVTSGSGPYTHVFSSGADDLPSASIEIGNPEVPSYRMFSGIKGEQVRFTMSRSGQLVMEVTTVAQGEDKSATTQAGTPTDIALRRFGHFNGSIERNSAALANMVSAEVQYLNNLDRVGTIRADGKIDGADEGLARMSGRLTARFADEVLFNDAINSTPAALQFAWSKGADSLTFLAHEVYLPRPRIPIEGPAGIQVSFDWRAALNAVAARMCTVTLVNDVETY